MKSQSKIKPIVPVSVREELAVPVAATVETKPVKEKTQAQKIWDQISNLRLDMFSLNNQFVHAYYKPMFAEPTRLYLVGITKASAALPALEVALAPKYKVEQAERFVIVTLAPAL